MNNVDIIGRICSNILKNYTEKNNKCVVKFSIAVAGSTQENTSFFDCEVWEKTAERVYEAVRKGDKIAISGHLQQQVFQKPDGTKSSRVVIVVSSVEYLSPKHEEKAPEQAENNENKEDDLPF